MPRKPPPRPKKGPRKPLPEELARDAIAPGEAAPGDKVHMTFRVLLSREQAEGSGGPRHPEREES